MSADDPFSAQKQVKTKKKVINSQAVVCTCGEYDLVMAVAGIAA